MKNLLMGFYYNWDSIMNLKYNPLSLIGDTSLQCYYMTVLSIAWSTAFSFLVAGWAGLMPLIVGHVAVIFALYFTFATFQDAKRDGKEWFVSWNSSYLRRKNKNSNKNICEWDLSKEA